MLRIVLAALITPLVTARNPQRMLRAARILSAPADWSTTNIDNVSCCWTRSRAGLITRNEGPPRSWIWNGQHVGAAPGDRPCLASGEWRGL